MTITLQEAQARLPELIENLRAGEELIISKDDRPVARIVSALEEVKPPQTGADLVAYWQTHRVVGSRQDIEDSSEHARRLREEAETRNHRGCRTRGR